MGGGLHSPLCSRAWQRRCHRRSIVRVRASRPDRPNPDTGSSARPGPGDHVRNASPRHRQGPAAHDRHWTPGMVPRRGVVRQPVDPAGIPSHSWNRRGVDRGPYATRIAHPRRHDANPGSAGRTATSTRQDRLAAVVLSRMSQVGAIRPASRTHRMNPGGAPTRPDPRAPIIRSPGSDTGIPVRPTPRISTATGIGQAASPSGSRPANLAR